MISACERRRAVGDATQQIVKRDLLGLGEIAEDVVGDQAFVARMADPDPHAGIGRAHVRVDRAQAVVTGMPTANLHPHAEGRQVEFVMQNDEIGRIDLEEGRGRPHRIARQVHVGFGLEQHDLFGSEPALGDAALELRPPGTEAMGGCDRLDRHEADVVAVPGILPTRIAETDDKLHSALLQTKDAPRRTAARRFLARLPRGISPAMTVSGSGLGLFLVTGTKA